MPHFTEAVEGLVSFFFIVLCQEYQFTSCHTNRCAKVRLLLQYLVRCIAPIVQQCRYFRHQTHIFVILNDNHELVKLDIWVQQVVATGALIGFT